MPARQNDVSQQVWCRQRRCGHWRGLRQHTARSPPGAGPHGNACTHRHARHDTRTSQHGQHPRPPRRMHMSVITSRTPTPRGAACNAATRAHCNRGTDAVLNATHMPVRAPWLAGAPLRHSVDHVAGSRLPRYVPHCHAHTRPCRHTIGPRRPGRLATTPTLAGHHTDGPGGWCNSPTAASCAAGCRVVPRAARW